LKRIDHRFGSEAHGFVDIFDHWSQVADSALSQEELLNGRHMACQRIILEVPDVGVGGI
jgi:hypothetical protein